jgi:putative ABC transport system permease protein
MNTTRTGFQANIDEVGAEMQQSGVTVSLGQNYFNGTLTGVYPNHCKINKREILYGRFINDIDIKDKRKVVVLSQDNAKELKNDYQNLIGQYVNVGNFAFKVVGIYKKDQSEMNKDAFSSFTTMKTMYNKGDSVGNIEYSFHGLPTQAANDNFEKVYRGRINTNHLAAPNDESAVWLWNRYTQSMQMNQGIGIIRTALWIVGLFTLLSGIVGVSNIMLITVKERTREFGIRKAIGASPASILKLIIIESVIITTIFGYTGMVLGVAANEYMNATIGHMKVDTGLFQATMFLNPTVGLDVCFEATLVIIIAGTIAGLIPARKAAKIPPIEALRAE